MVKKIKKGVFIDETRCPLCQCLLFIKVTNTTGRPQQVVIRGEERFIHGCPSCGSKSWIDVAVSGKWLEHGRATPRA